MFSKTKMEQFISEAVQTFAETIPGSGEWLKLIEITLIPERNRPGLRKAAFDKIAAILNDDIDTTEGEVIVGEKGIAVLLYSKYLSSSDHFKWSLWHELGHVCTLVYIRDLHDEATACVREHDFTDLAVGYAVWSEFAADCIANLVASPEDLPYSIETIEEVLVQQAQRITSERTIIPALLGHYCATYLSNVADKFMDDHPDHDCGIAEFTNRKRQALADLLDILIDQLYSDSFWMISRETLEALGRTMNRMWAAH